MRILVFLFIILIVFPSYAHSQDVVQLLNQVVQQYDVTDLSSGSVSSGFSFASLMGGIIFSCIGLGAFIFGKKNGKIYPMVAGIVLMIYPYFVRNTVALYVIGIVLIALLFIIKE